MLFYMLQILCWSPFYEHGSSWIPAWVSNYIHYKVYNEITYPFPNFNSATIEAYEWISNFIPHFTGHMITYSCLSQVIRHLMIHSHINPCCSEFVFSKHEIYFFFYDFLNWDNTATEFFLMDDKGLVIPHSQNHGFWWPDHARSQAISNHYYSSLITRRLDAS